MPLFLYHGPASPAKRELFYRKVCERPSEITKNLIICPSVTFAQQIKNRILQNLPQQTGFLGEFAVSWDDFLVKLVKQNLPRVHLADAQFSSYLIFLLICAKYPELKRPMAEMPDYLNELRIFFSQIKSLGLSLEQGCEKFSDKLHEPKILKLFADYQTELSHVHYFDKGDIAASVLNLLRKKQLKLTDTKFDLFIYGIYPLKPYQREILREFKRNFAGITLHLFYDEDFTQENPRLSSAYEDLGNMSDRTEYVPPRTAPNLVVHQFQSPAHEAKALTRHLKMNLSENKNSPVQCAVAAANPNYFSLLKNLFTAEKIPFATQTKTLLTAILPLREINLGHPYLHNKELPTTLASEWQRFKNPATALKIKALTALEDLKATANFLDTVFAPLATQVASTTRQEFWNEQVFAVSVEEKAVIQPVLLLDPEAALAFQDHALCCVGLTLENFYKSGENSLYSPQLASHRDFFEILEPASYRFKIQLEKLGQLLSSAQNPFLSAPLFDSSGKPTTELQIENGPRFFYSEDFLTENNTANESSSVAAKKANSSEQQTRDYFKTRKKSFSVSEIQEYINCPYRYYAKYPLGIGSLEKDSIEPGGDVKGDFTHTILQRLIQENESDYLEGLEYESYRKKIIARLGALIDEELQKNLKLTKFNKTTVDAYAYRVYKTVIGLIQIEADHFKSLKKRTTPKNYEWSFGTDPRNPFEIQTDFGAISLKGRIDRIDIYRTTKNFSVIDYKTGTPPSLTDIKTGKAIQLPLYVMAAQKSCHPQFTPSGAFYYGLKENEIKGFVIENTADAKLLKGGNVLSTDTWQDIQNTTLEKINATVKGIHQAEFDPNPLDPQTCRTCDYRRICGYNTAVTGSDLEK